MVLIELWPHFWCEDDLESIVQSARRRRKHLAGV